jgi:hypothetical protein
MSDGNPIAGLKDTQFDLTRKASVVVRLLERALAGERVEDLDRAHGRTILTAHGYPSTKTMHANLTALKPLGDLPVTFDIHTPERTAS